MRLGITILFGETEIDHVDLVAALADTHEEVVGLDVSVNKVARVDVLDSRDELVGKEENGLEREFAIAKVEQVFERRPAKIVISNVLATSKKRCAYSRSRTMAW